MRGAPRPAWEDSSIRAAIFDFDETLVDLEREHAEAHDALCRAMGDDPARLPESFVASSGTRILDDIREMIAVFGWNEPEEELLARRQQFFDDICRTSHITPMPGVARAVRELSARGVLLAIASSAVRSSIELVLDRLGMRDLFTVIVDGSDVDAGKPDPAAFLLTAEKLGVAPRDCVVFEDSHVGVIAAKRAGMVCVAVRNPKAATFQDLSAADVVLQSFEELGEQHLPASC